VTTNTYHKTHDDWHQNHHPPSSLPASPPLRQHPSKTPAALMKGAQTTKHSFCVSLFVLEAWYVCRLTSTTTTSTSTGARAARHEHRSTTRAQEHEHEQEYTSTSTGPRDAAPGMLRARMTFNRHLCSFSCSFFCTLFFPVLFSVYIYICTLLYHEFTAVTASYKKITLEST
jgi:hypothetical protein